MSKKRAKSGAGSAHGQKWEQALMSTPFYEEDKWNAMVTMVEGDQVDDYQLVTVMAAVVNSGIRKLFSIVTKQELYELVNELGNPKGKKPKEIPLHSEICEPVKAYLDAGEDVPLPLLARLLKFRLLDIKQKDVRRRDSERKGGGAEKSGSPVKKGDKKGERTKSPGKGKAGKKTPEPPSAKVDSKLRKRGEEDTDSKYIDDEPDDGPQHYVILSGFNHPHLLSHLAEVGINVDCIIKILAEDADKTQQVLATIPPDPAAPAPTDLENEDDAEAHKESERVALERFWRDILLVMQAAPEGAPVHNTARLEYVVRSEVLPESLEDPEKKTVFGTALFEDVACMMYDLLDARRQWQTYLDNLQLLHVPLYGDGIQQPPQEMMSQQSVTPGPPDGKLGQTGPVSECETKAARALPEVDMRYYNEMMNSIPQESASVPLVLHCMLEQIVASEEELDPPSEVPKPPRSDCLEDSLAVHISGVAFKLALTDEEKQKLEGEFDAPKSQHGRPKQPKLIYAHDHVTQRLDHVEGVPDTFKPLEAELAMLKRLPMASLAANLPKPPSKLMEERAARLQELLHFCATAGLTHAEIDRAFKQFVFECMDLTEVDANCKPLPAAENGKGNNLIPWDDPYPFFKNEPPEMLDVEQPRLMSVSGTSLSLSETSEPSKTQIAASQTDAVKADDLRKSLEAIEPPATKSESAASSRRSRSPKSAKRKSRKGSKSPGSEPPAPAPITPPAEGLVQSRPNSGGILKSPARSRAGSARSRSSSSVHFERDNGGMPIPQPGDEEAGDGLKTPRSVAESMEEVVDAQKRNLDQWCFAEHLEPDVLLQVLTKASHMLPHMDIYYHHRDHSLLVALHAPHDQQLQNKQTWQTNLHSNLGFRNYLEHVAESVQEWTEVQEAKFEAERLAKEVEKIQKDADESSSRPASGKAKKGRERSKSPKKAGSRAGRSSSRTSSTERPTSGNLFIREGSLKAQKLENERMKAELDELERQKQEKRAKSAQKKASKDAAVEKEKKSGSRSSSKSRLSKEVTEVAADAAGDEVGEPEKYWPQDSDIESVPQEPEVFTGYDVGNSLIHMSGEVTTLFPADGSHIRTEKIDFVQGMTMVKSTLMKDGHMFVVHVNNPKVKDPEEKPDETEKAELEKSEKELAQSDEKPLDTDGDVPLDTQPDEVTEPSRPVVGQHGSLNAQFSDGMSFSLSMYGPDGECAEGKKYEPAPYVAPVARSPSPAGKDASPTKAQGKGKGKTASATPEPSSQQVEEETREEEEEEEPAPVQPFQQLYVSCPDGLCVTYTLESHLGVRSSSEDERKLLVRQSYPFKTSGLQPCEQSRNLANKETSRLINQDGTVIKFMQNGTVIVLYADGQVSELTNYPPPLPSRACSPQRAGSAKSQAADRETPTKKGRARKTSASNRDTLEPNPDDELMKNSRVLTTKPSGERIHHQLDGTKLEGKDVLLCTASDPQTQQFMHTREDHVVTVCHPDNTIIVEHSDGTRITTFIRQVEVQSDDPAPETGEPPEATTQIVKFYRVECPEYATVKFDAATAECSTEFGSGTVLHTFPSGTYDIYHHDGTYVAIGADASTSVYPRCNNNLELHDPMQELQYCLKHFDEILIETKDNEGNLFKVKNTGECQVEPAGGDERCVTKETGENEKDNCPKSCPKELKHYKQHAPRFFIIHADRSGTELLRYQDVAEYLAMAEDDPMTAILTDPLADHPGVLGITVLIPNLKDMSQKWITSYAQDSIIPPGLTSRDLKTLPPAEYQKEGSPFGQNVGQGLMVGSMPSPAPVIPTLRCPSVLELRQIIQYKPVSEELRGRLHEGLHEYAEYVRARTLDSEALKVQDPRSEKEKQAAAELQMLAASGRASRIEGDVKTLYEKATAPTVLIPPPTPQPCRSKADWERDIREIGIEHANRKALREHDVPSYFDSELGKAFLLSQAPDLDALAKELAQAPRRTDGACSASTTPVLSENSYRTQNGNNNGNEQAVSVMDGETPPAVDQYSPSLSREVIGNTPSTLRPGNPTPAHAAGQGSPAPLRPFNPTPAHANKSCDRPGAPSPKEPSGFQASETPSSHAYPSIQELPQEEEDQTGAAMGGNPARRNVTGEFRGEPVPVPAYIFSGRPGAVVNNQFTQVEEPVRRRVYTSSVAGAEEKGIATLKAMRGFELLPHRVDFGILREGHTYAFTVHLKNTGVDSCRFKIRQPPPSTGIKIIYKPGPVAAGMKVELQVEIYAIAVGVEGDSGVGSISHHVEIITETDHLHLPITATVMTAHDYDMRDPLSVPKGKGVHFLTNKPPGGQGIIRPRRDQVTA